MGDWDLTGLFVAIFIMGGVVGVAVWELIWFLIRHVHMAWG
jgi:hypothetical protein